MIIEIAGTVELCYPRRWWQLRKRGWYKHSDGLGRDCWIRFWWPQAEFEKVFGKGEEKKYESAIRE